MNASPEKIWICLWEPAKYEKWTSAFTEGSQYKTESFTEGGRIHFLDGKGSGMYSDIDQMKPNRFLSFKHIGILKDGEEQPTDEETAQWTGAIESYELLPGGDITTLVVKVDTFESYVDIMQNSFPKALDILKSLAEQ